MKLSEFNERYEREIRQLLDEIPELDRREMFRPFWESRFLSASSWQLLMLSKAIPSKTREIINVLARVALGRFISEYLAAVSLYMEKEMKAVQKRAALKDPVLAQFLSEGLGAAAELLDNIHVNSLDDLAVFVSCLDYVSVFMNAADTPAKLKKELAENGLVKKDGEKCDT